MQMLDMGLDVAGPNLISSKFTLSRKKDKVRSRVAFSRHRVNGLFVNKQKEEQMERQLKGGYISDESETLCPTNE